MDRVRIVVVGAGYVAAHHLAALRSLDFVDVVAVCDLDLQAAAELAQRFGVPRSARGLDELQGERVDAVYVLTPPASHVVIARQAMEMGCHVLVEKPMADTAADCEALVALAKARGLSLGVNHSDLLDPVLKRAIEVVRAGRIGDVRSVDIVRNSDYLPYAGGPLPAMLRQGSYPLRDLGVHGLYTIEVLLGPIHGVRVDWQARGTVSGIPYTEWQVAADAGEGTGRLLLSWTARPMENTLVIRGTQGSIHVDRFLQVCREQPQLPGPKFVGIVLGGFGQALRDVFRIPWSMLRFATGRLESSPGIREGARAFARAVRDRKPPPFTGEDALRIAGWMDTICAAPDAAAIASRQARFAPLLPADALVTGAAGFLGRALVSALRARGQTVRVLVRSPSDLLAGDPGVQQVVGDLGDPEIVDHAIAGASVVYHVGAAMRGGPREFEAGTVWGTRNIVESCRKHGSARLVYVSSMSVFDHAGRRDGEVLTEDYRFEPHPQSRGAYTQTKLAAERVVVEAIERERLPVVILRPGQIFGPGAETVTPNGVVALAGRWLAIGKGACTLPLVYRDDVVDALLLAAESPHAVGRVFNIVDPDTVTRDDYLQRCKRKLGDRIRLLHVPEWCFLALSSGVEMLGKLLKRDVPLTRYRVRSLRPLANFDVSAAGDALGWTPRVGVREGLDRTFGKAWD